jgi:hypothetical protein
MIEKKQKTGGIILTGETEVPGGHAVQVPLYAPKFQHVMEPTSQCSEILKI